MSFLPLKTKRCLLREFREEDAQSLVKLLQDKEIYLNTTTVPYPYSLAYAQKWLHRTIKSYNKKHPQRIEIAIDSNEKLIGNLTLKLKGHRAELSYWIGKQYRRQGIMSEIIKVIENIVFNKLGTVKLYAYVFSTNKASLKLLKKNGFKKEGKLKKHIKKAGKLIDVYLYTKIK
jgi:[ribosomal protein S5]-alanine N-acetyltransferase